MSDETRDNLNEKDNQRDDNVYEDICYICRRPESKAGR